ncbi:MAG: DUF202 domain-containing protein [Actinobacteria bacterium]|nr:DUF202 domain-containing protein [Actinomycetota bacterium]
MTTPEPSDPAEGPTDPTPTPAAAPVEREPDPRFSYANERTFLAWIRTALGLITAGLVVTQLFPKFDLPFGRRLIGLPMISLGVLIALFSYTHWQRNEQAMRWGRPLPPSFLPRLVAIVVSVVAVVGFVLVLWEGID